MSKSYKPPLTRQQKRAKKREEAKRVKELAKAVETASLVVTEEAKPNEPESLIGKSVWSWTVVGAIVLFLLPAGIGCMTSGHPVLAYVFYMLGAVLFLSQFLTWEDMRAQPVKTRLLESAMGSVATLLLTGLAVWGTYRLNRESFIVHPQFKAASVLTPSRKESIARDVNSFITYLMSLGFKVPQEIPSIGVRNVFMESFVLPSQVSPVISAEIDIQNSHIDKRNAIVEPLASWLFHSLLPGQITDPKAWFDFDTANLYADYYTASFTNNYTTPTRAGGLTDWQNALWDLRTRYGHDFVDRLLCDSYQSWEPPQPGDAFDEFFWMRFERGLSVIDNNGENHDGVLSVMKAHGLPRK